MKALKFLFISVAILLLFWFGWTQYDYGDFPNPSIHLDQDIHFQDFPLDSTTGHIIGIQPIMTPADFTSEENYFLKLNNYLQKAEEKNWLKENSIVLFPEYIGTWLVVANQRKSIYQNERINAAMIQLIAMQPLEFLKNWLQSNAENKVNEAIFSMEAEKMAGIYQRTFSKLAAKYKINIVAGSIVLPQPYIQDGLLEITEGPLQNISAWFSPDGKIAERIIRKVYPINEELSFTKPGDLTDLPVFQTSMGRVASVICADSWYPEIYAHLKEKRVDILLVPSYSSPSEMWNMPWNGYNGSEAPMDVQISDIGNLTEQEAWVKYSMLGRAESASIAYGINTFLQGQLWDMSSAGDVFLIQDSKKIRIPSRNSPMMVRVAVKVAN